MEMHQIRYFLAVARSLNFTRAAEDLQVAQPSLTRAIQKLEAELEGPLFRRERTNSHLTELGRIMLPHLQATLAAAETAKSQARLLKSQAIGSLTIAVCHGIDPCGPVAFLLSAAEKLVHLNIAIQVDTYSTVERRLLGGQVDAAILAPIDDLNERFDVYLLHEDRMVVAFAAKHRFAGLDRITLGTLDSEPLVAHCDDRYEAALSGLMEAAGLRHVVRHHSNDARWTAAFVRSGMACAVLPKALAEAAELPHRNINDVSLQFRTMLATVAGRRHSIALASLIRLIATRQRALVTSA